MNKFISMLLWASGCALLVGNAQAQEGGNPAGMSPVVMEHLEMAKEQYAMLTMGAGMPR
jgi:hypothetical protein